jgi:hypothetical protein
MEGVEKRAEVVIKEFQVAISKKQGKALDVLVNIGVGAFKVAVKVGRESFLEFLTKTGMGILQLAVADNFEEGVRKLTRAWSKALIYAVKDEKSLLVRRMLELCVMDFKGLIEAERDDEARSLIKAGIEIQFAIIELENKSMMAIMTELWVDAFEELLAGRFAEETVNIIDGYVDSFKDCIPATNWEKMRLQAITLFSSLQRALDAEKPRFIKALSNVCLKVLDHALSEDVKKLPTDG